MKKHLSRHSFTGFAIVIAMGLTGFGLPFAKADESVFVEGLEGGNNTGEDETLLYVWTRDGDGKETDALSVVDANPKSPTFGEILYMAPTGSSANEAHHFGYINTGSRIFGGGLFSNKLFVYDLTNDPTRPELLSIKDLDITGYSGPHTLYAVPEGVMIAMLGGVDGGGPAGLILLDNDGNFIEAWPQAGHSGVPDYMYDVGVKPAMNRMITSAWAHPHHITMEGGAPPETVSNEVVVWNWETKEILQVEELDASPLEVRWLHGDDARGGFVNCAYGNSVWYWEDLDGDGEISFHRVIDTGDGSVPADMRVSYDNKSLYISLWGAGKVVKYDVSDPMSPKLVDEIQVPQPNMMKLSPDNERLYVTNSLLSTMDGEIGFEAWLIHLGENGMKLDPRFHPDFAGYSPNGPAGPHDMLLK